MKQPTASQTFPDGRSTCMRASDIPVGWKGNISRLAVHLVRTTGQVRAVIPPAEPVHSVGQPGFTVEITRLPVLPTEFEITLPPGEYIDGQTRIHASFN